MAEWFDKLQEAHVWSEPKTLEFLGNDPLWGGETKEVIENARECYCGAIDRGYGPLYLSCSLLTHYPADSDGPCRCTRKMYANAHGIEIK